MNYQDKKIPDSRYKIIRWFKLDQFEPERAFTSHWISSKTFFTIRLILALYTTITFWTFLGFTAAYTSFKGFFTAFTTLTFIGLHAYLITSCVHHFRYLWSKDIDFMFYQYSFLNYLYQWLYSTVVVFNVLTPVVFWSILNVAGQTTDIALLNWLNVSVHGISLFIMMMDVIFNRMKLPNRMVLLVLLTVLFYMFLAFVVYASENVWVYPFLDWSQGPKTAIWYFVVAILIVVIYFIMVGIHLLRDWVALKSGKVNQPDSAPINSEPEVASIA